MTETSPESKDLKPATEPFSLKVSNGRTAEKPFLTICIPSYNRTDELLTLLESIDVTDEAIEIAVSEDHAPNRDQVREIMATFGEKSNYGVTYFENEHNLGYDGNLRACIQRASGEFFMYMGDDDYFLPGKLDVFLKFLREHEDCGYILRAYCGGREGDKELEIFKYFPDDRVFEPGVDTAISLYKRSVTLSGLTFNVARALEFETKEFDGSLLYQLGIMSRIVNKYPSAYCAEPFAVAFESYRSDQAAFGASDNEKGLYTQGTITPENSVNFTKGYFSVAEKLDQEIEGPFLEGISKELSKYSYPFLSIQRLKGRKVFRAYAKRLKEETPLGSTGYFNLYYFALLILGQRACDQSIRLVKKVFGSTPEL